MVQNERENARGNLGREFPKLWAASAVSNLGDGVVLLAGPLLAASLTRDPALVAGLAFAQRLPWLLFPLISGALADRIDRRRAMAGVALGRAALIGLLGLAVLFDQASLPLLYAVFFLLGTGETLFDTAAATVLPTIVPREGLPRANARLAGTLMATNQFIGPPLGGFLFAAAAALPFLLGAGGLAGAAALILALRGVFRAERPRGRAQANLRGEVAEGLRWLWGHRLLRTLALALGVLNLTLVAQNAIIVLFARERLGLGPTGYGVLVTTYGLGGVLGSLVAGRVIDRLGASATLRLAVVNETLFPVGVVLSDNAYAVGVIFALFGCHATVWGALLASLRQELTPDPLRGRVASVYGLIEAGGAAPGALLGGLLATWLGLSAPFWVGAAAGVALLPFVWPVFSTASIAAARKEMGV